MKRQNPDGNLHQFDKLMWRFFSQNIHVDANEEILSTYVSN